MQQDFGGEISSKTVKKMGEVWEMILRMGSELAWALVVVALKLWVMLPDSQSHIRTQCLEYI
jgi:hypothetical protein